MLSSGAILPPVPGVIVAQRRQRQRPALVMLHTVTIKSLVDAVTAIVAEHPEENAK
jgi:hypothetical protein